LTSLQQMADALRSRLTHILRRHEQGRRRVFGSDEKMQTDPHVKDHSLFYASFDVEHGRGLGAPHQTGRSGLVAKMSAELHA
jgi:hypothetical protein